MKELRSEWVRTIGGVICLLGLWLGSASSAAAYPEKYKLAKTVFIPWDRTGQGLMYREIEQKDRAGKSYVGRYGISYFKVSEDALYFFDANDMDYYGYKCDWDGKFILKRKVPYSSGIIRAEKEMLIGTTPYKNEIYYLDINFKHIKTIAVPKKIDLGSSVVEAGVLFPGKNDNSAKCTFYLFDKNLFQKIYGEHMPLNKRSVLINEKRIGKNKIYWLSNLPDRPDEKVEAMDDAFQLIYKVPIAVDKNRNTYFKCINPMFSVEMLETVVIKLSPVGKILARNDFRVGDEFLTQYWGQSIPIDVDTNGNIYRARSTSKGVYVEKWTSTNK